MNEEVAIEREPQPDPTRLMLQLPYGLMGFEPIKQYALVAHPGEAPFAWLEVPDNPRLAFLVVEAGAAFPDYRPDVGSQDVEFLGLKQPEDALILTIVTLRKNLPPTANLKGPVVVNRHTWTAKQVIPTNAPELSVAQPLPVAG